MATKKAPVAEEAIVPVAPVTTEVIAPVEPVTTEVITPVEPVTTEVIAPVVTEEVLNELIAVAPEQEIPNADELFNAAMETSEERIAKELEIESMTPEQLQAEFGWSLSEAVGIMREAVINSKTHHADAINLMIDKIESLSK